MKRMIVGALVGGLIVFIWQALSHMIFTYHETSYRQVTQQDEAIQAIGNALKNEGQYLIPRSDPAANSVQQQEFEAQMQGKPWALVTYHSSYEFDMAMAVARSFTTACLAVLLFIVILGNRPGTFFSIFAKAIGLGVLIFSFVFYNQNIWLQTPWEVIRPEVYDLLIEWGLCGLWLGYWLTKKEFRHYA